MPADKELLRRRLENLKKFDVLSAPGTASPGALTAERLLAEIEEAENDSDVDFVGDRYLLVKKTYYQDQQDDEETELCHTLEQVEQVVIDFLFQEAGLDYGFHVDVYDLNLGRKLDYEVVKTVKWDFEVPRPELPPETPYTDCKLGIRARKAILKTVGGYAPQITLADVAKVTESDLRKQKNVGSVTVEEIRRLLARAGLTLADDKKEVPVGSGRQDGPAAVAGVGSGDPPQDPAPAGG